MRFLVDAQLPPALCRVLIDANHIAEHVAELGMLRASDAEIWAYAHRHGAIIVSKDEDFASRSRHGIDGPTVVWLRMGNCSNAALISRFAPLLPTIVELIEAGEALVEVR